MLGELSLVEKGLLVANLISGMVCIYLAYICM